VVGGFEFAPFSERFLLGERRPFDVGRELYELDYVARMILDRGQKGRHDGFWLGTGEGGTETLETFSCLTEKERKQI
jgi:hypothetical protein